MGARVGEIAIHGRIVMKGYWNRPDATTAVIAKMAGCYRRPRPFRFRRQPLYHRAREGLIVLSKGKNIYPEEIEAHYLKSP